MKFVESWLLNPQAVFCLESHCSHEPLLLLVPYKHQTGRLVSRLCCAYMLCHCRCAASQCLIMCLDGPKLHHLGEVKTGIMRLWDQSVLMHVLLGWCSECCCCYQWKLHWYVVGQHWNLWQQNSVQVYAHCMSWEEGQSFIEGEKNLLHTTVKEINYRSS